MGLKYERTLKGWKETDVSKRIGVSLQAVCQYENGRKMPSAKTIYNLAKLFGKPMEEVYLWFHKQH
jgi:transcriptional regulator with XRE-family HTH domain